MKKKRRDIVWHLYHTILAVELGAVAIIEFIELMYKWDLNIKLEN